MAATKVWGPYENIFLKVKLRRWGFELCHIHEIPVWIYQHFMAYTNRLSLSCKWQSPNPCYNSTPTSLFKKCFRRGPRLCLQAFQTSGSPNMTDLKMTIFCQFDPPAILHLMGIEGWFDNHICEWVVLTKTKSKHWSVISCKWTRLALNTAPAAQGVKDDLGVRVTKNSHFQIHHIWIP